MIDEKLIRENIGKCTIKTHMVEHVEIVCKMNDRSSVMDHLCSIGFCKIDCRPKRNKNLSLDRFNRVTITGQRAADEAETK